MLVLPITVVLLALGALGMMLVANDAANRRLWRQVLVAVVVIGSAGFIAMVLALINAAQM